MLALVVLKKGLQRIKGVLVSTSMSRTTKSTSTKKSRTLIGMSFSNCSSTVGFLILWGNGRSVVSTYS
jgi:hypothetical protein